jgi:hypothetical protein
MDNLYKLNLECFCNLKNNQYMMIENNKIKIDDRYFSNWRYDNSPKKIEEIIQLYIKSFMYFLDLIKSEPHQNLINKNSENFTILNIYEYNSSIILLLEHSLNGLNRFADNYKYNLKKQLYEKINETYINLKNELYNLEIQIKEDRDNNLKKINNNVKTSNLAKFYENSVLNGIIWTNALLFFYIIQFDKEMKNHNLE